MSHNDCQNHQAIEAATRFLRTLKHTHSPEVSVDVYDSLKEILGKNFMGCVLQEMIAERYNRIVILHDIPNGVRIQVIKLLREYTGIGLKEAKDIVDDVVFNGRRVPIREQPPETTSFGIDELASRLRAYGAVISQDIDLTG
jgi:ribosomal protein L7/L12